MLIRAVARHAAFDVRCLYLLCRYDVAARVRRRDIMLVCLLMRKGAL